MEELKLPEGTVIQDIPFSTTEIQILIAGLSHIPIQGVTLATRDQANEMLRQIEALKKRLEDMLPK